MKLQETSFTDAPIPSNAALQGRQEVGNQTLLSSDQVRRVEEMLSSARSANTKRSYETAGRYWIAWHRLRAEGAGLHGPAFPITYPALVQFILDHSLRFPQGSDLPVYDLPDDVDRILVDRGAKVLPGPINPRTLTQRLAGLKYITRRLGMDVAPFRDPRILEMMTGARIAGNQWEPFARRPRSIDSPELALPRLLSACGDDTLGLRDRALILATFASGGRRRSEALEIRIEDLRRCPQGYEFTLRRSKTDQQGDNATSALPLYGPTATAIDAWLAACNRSAGPLFPGVRGHKLGTRPMSGEGMRQMLYRRSVQAGLTPVTPHDLRRWFVTEALSRDTALNVVKLTQHRDLNTLRIYDRSRPADNPSSWLAQDILNGKGTRADTR